MKGKHRPIKLMTFYSSFVLMLALWLGSNLLPVYAMAENANAEFCNGEYFNFKITGTVIDDQGEVVIGATIQLKGTSIGAVTDENGKFSIEVPDGNAVLIVSFVGY